MIAGWKLYAAAGAGGLAVIAGAHLTGRMVGAANARAECAERAAEDIAEAAEKAVEAIAEQAGRSAAATERLTSAAEIADAARARLKGELDALPRGPACFDAGAHQRMQNLFDRLFPAEPLPAERAGDGADA